MGTADLNIFILVIQMQNVWQIFVDGLHYNSKISHSSLYLEHLVQHLVQNQIVVLSDTKKERRSRSAFSTTTCWDEMRWADQNRTARSNAPITCHRYKLAKAAVAVVRQSTCEVLSNVATLTYHFRHFLAAGDNYNMCNNRTLFHFYCKLTPRFTTNTVQFPITFHMRNTDPHCFAYFTLNSSILILMLTAIHRQEWRS
jgi:hypothetical protein